MSILYGNTTGSMYKFILVIKRARLSYRKGLIGCFFINIPIEVVITTFDFFDTKSFI